MERLQWQIVPGQASDATTYAGKPSALDKLRYLDILMPGLERRVVLQCTFRNQRICRTMRNIQPMLFFQLWGIVLVFVSFVWIRCPEVSPATFADDFAEGARDVYWTRWTNQPLYEIDDSRGEVRFSKPVGGDYSFQAVALRFKLLAGGDFDVQVDFREASITRADGSPGNQVQLNVACEGEGFLVVRSDEAVWGHNVHIWRSPPNLWYGARATSETSGTLRITRVGDTATGYYNGGLVWSGSFPTSPVQLSFPLQNNGTKDATSVVFDNFQVTADYFVPRPVVIQTISQSDDSVTLLLTNMTGGATNVVERSVDLSSGVWTEVDNFISGWEPINWSELVDLTLRRAFYRVRTE